MATYDKQFNGYVADVPKLWFKRCDGKVFHFDELTKATVSPTINQTEINAGWSTFPVASLPGTSTLELKAVSSRFDADLFSMTNAVNFKENLDYEVPVEEHLQPVEKAMYTITIPAGETQGSSSFSVGAGRNLFLGLYPANATAARAFVSFEAAYTGLPYETSDGEEASSDLDGTFIIRSTPGAIKCSDDVFTSISADANLTIKQQPVDVTFYLTTLVLSEPDDTSMSSATLKPEYNGNELSITAYRTSVTAVQEANIDNKTSAVGEAILVYPVYGSAGSCSEASVIGRICLKIYRARISARPGFETSYKSTATFPFTLTAMEAKRADGMNYSIAYISKFHADVDSLNTKTL